VPVAVFNFGMKSDTPERKWLEKGLADRVITDMYRVESVTVVQRDIMQEAAERTRWARCRRAGTPCGSMRPTRRGPGESL
jgi:TolB-like protein